MKGLFGIVIVGLLLVVGFMGCNGYNGLIKEDETVSKAWNDVQAEYQRRGDLVGNLVNTVKGAANFEQKTLTDVITARSKATSINVKAEDLTPEKMAQFQAAQGDLSSALGKLLMITENYPELKANQNFLQLQGQLESIENGIRSKRELFNTAVQSYNTKVRSFPINILGGIFGFKAKEGFKADEAAQKAPSVKFD